MDIYVIYNKYILVLKYDCILDDFVEVNDGQDNYRKCYNIFLINIEDMKVDFFFKIFEVGRIFRQFILWV